MIAVRKLMPCGAALCLTAASLVGAQQNSTTTRRPTNAGDSLASLRRGFAAPPMEARPMMRWWWFGPAVEPGELARELRTMKAGGIGGVEIQPVYPLQLDDPQKGFRNLKFLSPEFLKMVTFAANTGHELGMRVSITLGSGWPYGGAWVPVTESAGRLRVVAVAVPAGLHSVAVPSLENGETLLASFVAAGTSERYDADHARRVEDVRDGRLQLPSDLGDPRVALFFISSRTGQQVKRPAYGAEGFVIDHFSAGAVQDHLRNVADPIVGAFGDHPPYSVFSDSLEVYESDWTADFLSEFRNRRGYDLTPYLPELVAGTGPEAADLRYDWGRTLAELIDQNYLGAINAWAHAHHTEFRSQTYGSPAVTLSSNSRVDLPEGEGSQWHGPFSFTRWATSASHVYGRPVTSSETWTWLHSPAFSATPLDMKAEADTFFLQGINQLVGHGWPYSPASAGEPGYSFYAAAVFNDHNPWWIVMPDVTAYLTRMSWLLRQGQPANDVAVLLPEEDAEAHFRLGEASVSGQMAKLLGTDLVPAILDAGYNFDFIDSEAIDRAGVHYPVLVIPDARSIPLATYRKIAEYVKNGGMVLATGDSPTRAPGLVESPRDTPRVLQISKQLFAPDAQNAKLVKRATDLGPTIGAFLKPDVALEPATPEVGFIHRKLADADIYFLANTDNRPHVFSATFRTERPAVSLWDPFSGKISDAGEGPKLSMTLAPYASQVVVFTDRAVGQKGTDTATNFSPIDLDHDWKVTLDKTGFSEAMHSLHSWSDDEAGRYYSGTASYTRTVDLPADFPKGATAMLDFGAGSPVRRRGLNFPGMRTWLDAPLRDAAVVYVDGKRAGSVWHPPFVLDIGPFLHAGSNELKIVVANTAINELAGRTPTDYRLLWMRYGKRFAPQDMDHLEALPSGILGPLRLVPAGETSGSGEAAQ
ncbi:MAG TPA: glycosyl hydrolase [Acidobacteriaceae bacterium]|nr:glycosyl hydrolase [Acidobacteriaceae bacterium]